MGTLIIRCEQRLDETGALEQFTNDPGDRAAADARAHLTTAGLPQLGTSIHPGMALVGKVGHQRPLPPDPIEQQPRPHAADNWEGAADRLPLCDSSFYAPPCRGVRDRR